MVERGKASAVTELGIFALLSHFDLHRHCNAQSFDTTSLFELEVLEVLAYRFKGGCFGDDVGAVVVMQSTGRSST